MGILSQLIFTMKLYLLSSLLVVTTYSASLETSSGSVSSTSSVRTSSRLMSGSTNNRTRSSAIVQSMDCYDYNNQGGDRLHLTDYAPSLRNYNFDNRIESCCFTGIWLLYDLDNYGKGTTNSMDWWAYGNNYCTNVPSAFINRASSARFTGAPDDWNYDTINMYFNEYFIGDEEFTYNDTPMLNYDNRAQSIVVTGCHPWTIYEYDSYRGYSMCLYPESTVKCTPGFYSTRQSLGRLANQVSSVRKGCYAKHKVLPDNHGLAVRGGDNGGIGRIGGSWFNQGNE